jgi:phosphoenolpyruvate synthase/pyruvate phosphate dikinase
MNHYAMDLEEIERLGNRTGSPIPRRLLDELAKLEGGREARDAIRVWLDKYGMRCVGEIDITKPRWSERPTTLVPLILGNIKNFQPGAGERRFEQGRQGAWKTEQELLQRLRALPGGERKAEEAKRMIDLVRAAGAYRCDDLPAGALVGLPVSAGTIEGRARVILDMAEAVLEPGRTAA